MSPLVALLALACATPLLAARFRRDDPVNECASKIVGTKTYYAVALQRGKNIAKYDADAEIEVANNCALVNMNIVGEEVVVCDCDKPPNIVVDTNFTPILIHRNGNLNCEATVDITQYCQ